jgi:hypothetical protein
LSIVAYLFAIFYIFEVANVVTLIGNNKFFIHYLPPADNAAFELLNGKQQLGDDKVNASRAGELKVI